MKTMYAFSLLKDKDAVYTDAVTSVGEFASVDEYKQAAQSAEKAAQIFLQKHPNIDADEIMIHNWDMP